MPTSRDTIRLHRVTEAIRRVLLAYLGRADALERANNLAMALHGAPETLRDTDGLHSSLTPTRGHAGIRSDRDRAHAIRDLRKAWIVATADDHMHAWVQLQLFFHVSPACASKWLQDLGATLPAGVARA